MGKGLDTGKAFYQGLLSKITDPGQRQAAEALLVNTTFLTELGNGVEGQSEIDRTLSKLRTETEALDARRIELDQREEKLGNYYQDLTGWFNEKKPIVEEAERIKAGGVKPTPPTPAPAKLPDNVLTTESYAEREQRLQASFLGFQRDWTAIQSAHLAKFKELPAIEPYLQHPKIGEIGLLGVYELVNKDRLEKYDADAKAAEAKRIGDEAVRKYQETQATMPYPTPTGVGSGSPLDALKPANAEPVVDAAVAHYHRLQQERAGAPGAGV